jgi:hypothetical protein
MEPDNNPLHALLSVTAIQHELNKRRVQRKHLLQPKQQQLLALLSAKGVAAATWLGYPDGGSRRRKTRGRLPAKYPAKTIAAAVDRVVETPPLPQ